MTLTKRSSLIKRLQTTVPRGGPLDHRDLAPLGVSSALAHHYLKSGWLLRLERGVFAFRNDTLREQDCLKGIEEARSILEGARALRPDVLATLLKHCLRVKVARLCVLWAAELNLPWAEAARKAAGTRFGQSRWTARLKDGTTLILRAYEMCSPRRTARDSQSASSPIAPQA